MQQTEEAPAAVKADGNGMEAEFAARWPTLPQSASTFEHAPAQMNTDERRGAELQDDTRMAWPVATTAKVAATEQPVAEPAVADQSSHATATFKRVLAVVGILALLCTISAMMLTIVDVRRRRRHRAAEPGDRARQRLWLRPRELHWHPMRPQSSGRHKRGRLAARL